MTQKRNLEQIVCIKLAQRRAVKAQTVRLQYDTFGSHNQTQAPERMHSASQPIEMEELLIERTRSLAGSRKERLF